MRIERRRDSGFTLLEVMAAFVIASLGSILLYQAGFDGVAGATAAARLQEAVVRAQSRLASIGVLTPLQAEQLSGDDGGGYQWALDITPDQSNGTLTLYRVRLTERYGRRQITLSTERLGPAQ
jgi:general secretion pathway protein I